MEAGQEKPRFAPVLTIRPHHLRAGAVHDAFLGQEDPKTIIERYVHDWHWYRKLGGDPSGYFFDLLGKSLKARRKFKKSAADFLTRVHNLQDEDFVQLDMQPDGFCRACTFGRHCLGTNYQSTIPPRDPTMSESKILNAMRESLERKGFRQGSDFIVQPTKQELNDFQGKAVRDFKQAVSKNNVVFNSLVVRVSALRAIFKI